MENPRIGIGVLVVKDNKILFIKRKNSHGAGSWCPPGGHLEFNECLEECAKREVLEETGVKIKNIRFLNFTNDFFKKDNKHFITLHFISDYRSGEAKNMEPDKCDEIGWFDWNNLPKPLFLSIENLLKKNFNPFNNERPIKENIGI